MAIQRLAGLNTVNLSGRIWSTIRENWYLGFTSFGGPPVHFKMVSDPTAPPARSPPVPNGQWVRPSMDRLGWMTGEDNTQPMTDGIVRQFHDKFVTKLSWINEQVVGTCLSWLGDPLLTLCSTKNCSASARPSQALAAPRCITASFFSTTVSFLLSSASYSGGMLQSPNLP